MLFIAQQTCEQLALALEFLFVLAFAAAFLRPLSSAFMRSSSSMQASTDSTRVNKTHLTLQHRFDS
jgi:hypothetical protein